MSHFYFVHRKLRLIGHIAALVIEKLGKEDSKNFIDEI